MKPNEAIHVLSSVVYQDDKQNGVRLYLIGCISKAMLGHMTTLACKQILKEYANIDLEFETEVIDVDVRPVGFCGFRGSKCKVKKNKILSKNYHATEYGNNLINSKKNVGK